jgi:chaperonin GroEL
MGLKRGIEQGVEAAVAEIERMAKKVKSKEDLSNVGSVAANGDRVVGDLLAEAMEKVGKDGVVTVEESKTIEDRDLARGRRGNAIRSRLYLTLFRHQPG